MTSDIAYGIKAKPSQRRPTKEEAIKAKQVRYYGIKKIMMEELEKLMNQPDLQKEQVKLKNMTSKIEGLVKKKETLKSKIDNPARTKKEKKEAQKELDKIKKQAPKIIKQFKEQDKLVKKLKKEFTSS